jgi:Protein of unknown function (DUF3089)
MVLRGIGVRPAFLDLARRVAGTGCRGVCRLASVRGEASVLRKPEDLTVEWLREALRCGAIDGFRVERVGTGQMSESSSERKVRRRWDSRDRFELVRLAIGLLLAALAGACAPAAAQARAVWLCRPGLERNPCLASREATVVSYEGAHREEAVQAPVEARSPPIDCFYVYPTVSEQRSENASLAIEPAETQVARAQASRFSQVCKVYAPVYEQITLRALRDGGGKPIATVRAYLSVLGSFLEYLHRYNKGRGFVLIGHSQGALLLTQLIKERIDANAALRRRLVSAILLGGNVLVPDGRSVGATFEHVPACEAVAQTGCVVAYSSYAREPPANAYFGRPGSPLLEHGKATRGTEVLCVNPTLAEQNGQVGSLLPYAPTARLGYARNRDEAPEAATPWVEEVGLVTAQCEHRNGASWLQVSPPEGVSAEVTADRAAHHEQVKELMAPEWGLHVDDVNEALGNLVGMVGIEARSAGSLIA